MISSNGVEHHVKQNGEKVKQLRLRYYTLVCIKWSHLIAERTKKVISLVDYPEYSSDYVYYQVLGSINGTCLMTLFPNLITVLYKFYRKVKDSKNMVSFVRNHESLKGIINFLDVPIEKYCDKLEMLSSDRIEPDILQNGSCIKQLHTWNDYEDLKRVAHHFPNLERLHISIIGIYCINISSETFSVLVALLDVRECPEVTRRTANYVEDYCKRYGRSIKFYFEGNYHEIGTDWPQLSTKQQKISRGFDFMKNCFLKDFDDLPCFSVSDY
uniref:Uncharacterized protein n=1 Tax=Tetranychus urticae TaxID=32264 RepID=T1L6H6_TETUR